MYTYDRRAAAKKFPDVVNSMVEYLETGPFKSHLKVKSARGDLIVLTPIGLNSQVDHIEIMGLNGAKAQFVIHMKNGDSGWDWDEWRIPPKFHNNPGYNVIHLDRLDRLANPKTDPEKFAQHMMSICKGTLVPAIQKAGFVRDPSTKKVYPLAEWEAKAKPVEDIAKKLRAQVIDAIKRVGDGVRGMGLGSVVEYNPQERIDEDHHGIHGTFFLRIDHPQVNPTWRPGLRFYWDKSKESGSIGCSNLVWRAKEYENVPLAKMGGAMLDAADDILADLKRQLGQTVTTTEVWSVVTTGKRDGYAAEVDTFSSKENAEREARSRGGCYVVKGTQMWNEPLGQVEEHDRPAPYRFFQ